MFLLLDYRCRQAFAIYYSDLLNILNFIVLCIIITANIEFDIIDFVGVRISIGLIR